MKLLSSSLLLFLASCAGSDLGQETFALGEESIQAVGMLRMLNAEQTDFETLDIAAGLDRRAARNLIDTRNGADGFFGTRDDLPFQTVAEVDAIRYVGPSALAKISAYAEIAGYLPGPDEVLGEFDSVSFTFAEAAATLAKVNSESEDVLDLEIDLDRRAVNSILAARPVESMAELAGLYYVGASALGKLKTSVAQAGLRADCRDNSECSSGERCEGIPFDGSSEFGKCRNQANVEGAGANCSVSEACGADLFCAGLTFGEIGFCIEDWQQDTFENLTSRTITGSTPVLSSVVVRGQASVPFDITVDVDLEHQAPQNLRITLFDPNGADAILWDGPSAGNSSMPTSFIAFGSISRDDTVNGRWQLEVRNVVNDSDTGTLEGWTLWLSSNFD